MGGERVGERRARPHFLVHVVEHTAERRRHHTPLEQVERLHERHARLQQRGQFLVEDQELAGVDVVPMRQVQRQAANRALGLEREDIEPFLLELVAQPGFGVGNIDAFDNFAVGRSQAAAKFHRAIVSR